MSAWRAPGCAGVWRGRVAPAVRRVRREVQWRRARIGRLRRGEIDGAQHLVAGHATPLFRELVGLDPELQHGKVTNLVLAVARLDGILLGPGQTFSFWRHVGSPSTRRGFVEGLVLDHGRLTRGVGGGMCQLTNLLYWMTLHTDLTVSERWRHSYDVFPDAGRTQPFGSGATCAWPVLDLQVRNDTRAVHRLRLRVSGTHLEGEWLADRPATFTYEVYEAHHVLTNDAPGVFQRHNVVRRRVRDADGTVVADEVVAVNQALLRYAPFLEARPGVKGGAARPEGFSVPGSDA